MFYLEVKQDSDFFNCSGGIFGCSSLESKIVSVYIQEVSIVCVYKRSQEKFVKEQQLNKSK